MKLIIVLMMMAVLAPACKEPELVGIEVLPDGEGYPAAWVDTFTLVLATELADSVITSNRTSYLLGEINDPIFGISRAELYTQFRLPSSSVTFSNAPQIDSVVLNMMFTDFYGNVSKYTGVQTVGVYRLESSIYDTTNYYSNGAAPDRSAQPLAVKTFRPNLVSNVPAGADTLPPSLRIRLDDAFGQEILNSTSTTLSSNDEFVKIFKGLAIIPENNGLQPDQGAIFNFNMTSSNTRVELHYKQNDTARTFILPIDVLSATHTRFEVTHTPAITSVLGDSEAAKQNTYVQAMGGLRTKVTIPYLHHLRALGHIAVNKAELVIPIDDSDISRYFAPNFLIAIGIDSSSSLFAPIDYSEPGDHAGGAFIYDRREYVINVSRHLQFALDNPSILPNGALYLQVADAFRNARRAVILGNEHPIKPLKLRMTYTIIQ
jgi:hypothetical protein